MPWVPGLRSQQSPVAHGQASHVFAAYRCEQHSLQVQSSHEHTVCSSTTDVNLRYNAAHHAALALPAARVPPANAGHRGKQAQARGPRATLYHAAWPDDSEPCLPLGPTL